MKKKNKVGLGLLAATATAAGVAAGYYFYASKNAKKHRRIASKWAGNLKKDVIKQAKKVTNIDRDTLAGIIDKASAAYRNVKNVGPTELSRATKELKNNWKELMSELSKDTKRAKSTVKRTVRKATATSKKAAKKITS